MKMITNIYFGFKLTISISFGESVLSVGFNQKTAKEDLFIKGNYGIPLRKQSEKTLEGTIVEWRWLPPPAGQPAMWAHMSSPLCYVGSPPP